MIEAKRNNRTRQCLSIGTVFVGLLTLSACQTPEQERYADRGTCSDMGARFGSPSYTSCMLQQQQRRDNAHYNFLQEHRLNQKIAEDAREMHERVRRERRRD